MTQIREPAVAGQFYPAGNGELENTVRAMLSGVPGSPESAPKAMIVPHAGYIYSGPVAATAYARLQPYHDEYTRVVLLGPSHRIPLDGLAVSGADAFRTPLGVVPLDRQVIARLEHPAVVLSDAPHQFEHSLEVQLPFLQTVLDSFSLVPLAVGDAAPDIVAEVIESLWNGQETLIVVSSDLSHYHDYEKAQRLDHSTCRSIESKDVHGITPQNACGSGAIRGLLLAAGRRSLRVTTLDLRNSGDTAGGKSQVVGYGAWILEENLPCH
jgi:AmmeMemoRadiSam system protein B